MSKRSLYKPATHLQRSSLQLGKPQAEGGGFTAKHRSTLSHASKSPATDCTHSLSFCDKNSNDGTSSCTSSAVGINKVTSTKTLPVKLTKQTWEAEIESDSNMRRFSSNFVPLPSSLDQKKESTEEKVKFLPLRGYHESSIQHCSREQPLLSNDPSGISSVSVSTVLDDCSPDLSELSKAINVREKGKTGVERSASEEVMGTRQNNAKTDSLHSHSLNTTERDQTSTMCSEPASTKRKPKKGRVIASRYMSATNKKANLGHVLHTDQTSTASGLTSASSTRKTHKLRKEKAELKEASGSTKQTVHLSRQNHLPLSPQLGTPAIPPSHTPVSLQYTPPSMTTSTPAHMHCVTPAFHNISNVGSANVSTVETKKTLKAHSDNSELHAELLLAKLLQSSYMDIMSARSMRLQEEEAKLQIHQLWQSVEDKKREVTLLKKMVEAEERTLALEKAVENQLKTLGPLNGKLHVLDQQYSIMAKALDTTSHEMPFKRVLPCSEEEIQAKLAISEQLLGDVTAIIREKVPKVVNLTNSSEVLVNTLEEQYKELQMCWEELSLLVKTEIHNTSLFFEERQRNRIMEDTSI